MPHGALRLPEQIDFVTVLSENGTCDEKLAPSLSEDVLLKQHRVMCLARRFDERMLNLQRQGQIGTFAPVKGQEAAQVGSISTLNENDWFVPSFRETAAALWRGASLANILLYAAGYNEGAEIPEEQHDLPVAVPVGTQMLHAVGIAYGIKHRDEKQVVMTFFGDGATSEGDFHEAMNFAAVFEVPVVFVCQNNQWAISVPRDKQTRSETLAQKALAYGMPGVQVDGNDVLGVFAATQDAVRLARKGKGPTMIECVTYRMEVHTTADDPSKYRDEEEVERWKKRDPLERLQRYLVHERKVLSSAEIDELEQEIEKEIEDAWQSTKKRMAELDDPVAMFEHIYADLPPHLERQRKQLCEELKAGAEGGSDG